MNSYRHERVNVACLRSKVSGKTVGGPVSQLEHAYQVSRRRTSEASRHFRSRQTSVIYLHHYLNLINADFRTGWNLSSYPIHPACRRYSPVVRQNPGHCGIGWDMSSYCIHLVCQRYSPIIQGTIEVALKWK